MAKNLNVNDKSANQSPFQREEKKPLRALRKGIIKIT